MNLVNTKTGAVVVEQLELADTWWTRFKGLQFRRDFPREHGLLIVPCGSIHTCWLRWPITVVALDKHGKVLDIRRGGRPWRVVFLPRETHATLELSCSAEVSLDQDDRLLAGDVAPEECRPSIAFVQEP